MPCAVITYWHSSSLIKITEVVWLASYLQTHTWTLLPPDLHNCKWPCALSFYMQVSALRKGLRTQQSEKMQSNLLGDGVSRAFLKMMVALIGLLPPLAFSSNFFWLSRPLWSKWSLFWELLKTLGRFAIKTSVTVKASMSLFFENSLQSLLLGVKRYTGVMIRYISQYMPNDMIRITIYVS